MDILNTIQLSVMLSVLYSGLIRTKHAGWHGVFIQMGLIITNSWFIFLVLKYLAIYIEQFK